MIPPGNMTSEKTFSVVDYEVECQILFKLFKQHGISDCYNLLGGILEWQGEIVS